MLSLGLETATRVPTCFFLKLFRIDARSYLRVMLSELDHLVAGLRETLNPGFDHLQTEGGNCVSPMSGKKWKPSNKRVKIFRRLTALKQLLQKLQALKETATVGTPSSSSAESDIVFMEREVEELPISKSIIELPNIRRSNQEETPAASQQRENLQDDVDDVDSKNKNDGKVEETTRQDELHSTSCLNKGDSDSLWAALRLAVKEEVEQHLSSSSSSSSLLSTSSLDCRLRVAYFPDPIKSEREFANGNPQSYAQSIATTLKQTKISLQGIDFNDIRTGKLNKENFDLIIVPGGYVSNYSRALGKDGKQAIVDFVKQGGGYIGICAGAYLGTSCASRKKRSGGLGLLPDVSVMDYEHWARGRSDDCVLKLQDAGVDTLCGCVNKPTHLKSGEHIITRYCNGPLLTITPRVSPGLEKDGMFPPLTSSPLSSPTSYTSSTSLTSSSSVACNGSCHGQGASESVATFVSDFTNLATFGKKIIKPTGFKELPRGIMNKTHAIVRGYSGEGRVVLISPHLEDGEPLARQLLRASVRWVVGAPPSLGERPFIDVDQIVRWRVRESFLCCRIPKHPEWQTDEDKAQALANLLPANRIIPRPFK